MHSAHYWIDKLALTPHVEGGAYAEVYRAQLTIPQSHLTPQHHGSRSIMTSIYFLLQAGEFSALHRIASDELWHHYDGHELEIIEITTSAQLIHHRLGTSPTASPFVCISAGSWFGSRVANGGTYTLCGCTVAPGFDFHDFQLANRQELINTYPQYQHIITQLTRI